MTRRTRHTVRYAFDEANRLVISRRSRPGGAWRVAERLEGRVEIDGKNRLRYVVDQPAPRDGRHGIQLDGAWRLTADRELALALHEAGTAERQTLYLKGAITQADAHRLVLTLDEPGTRAGAGQRIALSGRWAADARNRLTFLAERADGSEDRLTLEGGWEVDRRHSLVYRYRRRPDGRRGAERTVIFDGAWDVTSANRLTYHLAGSDGSRFEFRGTLQSPSLIARRGELVYQLGIGVSALRSEPRRISLFGTWKLGEGRAVTFEVPYRGGRVQAIKFLGTVAIALRNRVQVALAAAGGRPLGITVTFIRELTPNAAWFLEARRDDEARGVFGGVRVRF